MVCAGSPTTQTSSRPPSHRSSRLCCSGLTSWYSSTTKVRYCRRISAATRSSSASSATAQSSTSSRSIRPRSSFTSSYAAKTRAIVAGSKAASVRPERGASLRVVVRPDVAHLGPLDLTGQVAQRGRVHPDPAPRRRLGQQRELAIHDRRQLPAVHLGPEPLRLPQRGGVERARLDALDAELGEPAAHLPRGPLGERHREDAERVERRGADAVRDPVGDRPRLAGAGARHHHDRPVQRGRDGPLLGVERLEQRSRSDASPPHRPGQAMRSV